MIMMMKKLSSITTKLNIKATEREKKIVKEGKSFKGKSLNKKSLFEL
jgi:hypothetical protein